MPSSSLRLLRRCNHKLAVIDQPHDVLVVGVSRVERDEACHAVDVHADACGVAGQVGVVLCVGVHGSEFRTQQNTPATIAQRYVRIDS